MVNFGPLAAEICWRVLGTPVNFNGFRVFAALLHGVEQRALPIFGTATITLGIGPHSSLFLILTLKQLLLISLLIVHILKYVLQSSHPTSKYIVAYDCITHDGIQKSDVEIARYLDVFGNKSNVNYTRREVRAWNVQNINTAYDERS